MKKTLLLLTIIGLSPLLFGETKDYHPQEGRLHTEGFDWNTLLSLDGQWMIDWNQLTLEPGSTTQTFSVPAHWGAREGGTVMDNLGASTYHLIISGLPQKESLSLFFSDVATAYRVLIRDRESQETWGPAREIFQAGVVHESKEKAVSHFLPGVVTFQAPTGEILLTIQVSNFTVDKGGLWSTIKLGLYQKVLRAWTMERAYQFILIGILTFIILLYTFYFLQRPQDRYSLYFALFCLLIILREFTAGRLAWIIGGPEAASPQFFNFWAKGEFLVVYLMPGVFMLFMKSLFPREVKPWVSYTIMIPSFTMGLLATIVPLLKFAFIIPVFQGLAVLTALYSVYIYFKAVRLKRHGALAGLLGIGFFSLTIINDILHAQEIIQTGYLMGFGFLGFLMAQVLLFSIRYNRALNHAEILNKSLYRFVPQQIIRYLGKESILDVRLGDAREYSMTVLFSDIRNFTTLSETMTPEQTFRFLNSYLSRISPVIRAHNGFIDKYMGDGLLALFPGSPVEGVKAALDIMDSLDLYNQHRRNSGYPPINIGIGIHSGNLVLGTIGENERIDGTVIADSVNVSSRLEEITKTYCADIIVSEDVLSQILEDTSIGWRRLGIIALRGRKQEINIYQVMRSEDPRLKYKNQFEKGVDRIVRGEEKEAKEIFRELKEAHPEDNCLASFD